MGYVAILLKDFERFGHRDKSAESRIIPNVNLSGKVLVITGSDGVLGQAVAATLCGYGAKVALVAHGEEAADGAARRFAALRRSRFDARRGRAIGDGPGRPRRQDAWTA